MTTSFIPGFEAADRIKNLIHKDIAILEPREELLCNCSFHPLRIITPEEKLSFIPLNVGCQGIDIKQNARISTLRIVKR